MADRSRDRSVVLPGLILADRGLLPLIRLRHAAVARVADAADDLAGLRTGGCRHPAGHRPDRMVAGPCGVSSTCGPGERQLLQAMSQKLRNVETKNALQTNSSEIARKIVTGLEKALKQGSAVPEAPEPVKKTGLLTAEELKLFGFDQGKIAPNTTKDAYYEAIKIFINSDTAENLSQAEKSNYIDRFKTTYNESVKVKENLLDPSEIKFFKMGEKPLESLNEIRPNITQDQAFAIAQSLHKKRLEPEIKKDLLIKFFNTIRDKKIKANKALTPREELWLDPDKIARMAEAVVRPKSRIEYFKGQPPMSEEERADFKKEDLYKQHVKQEDVPRVTEIARGALLQITRLQDNIKKSKWKEGMDRLAKDLKNVIPPVGDLQEYIEDIEKTLEGMNISSADLSTLLNVEDGVYKPLLDDVSLKNIVDRHKILSGSLEKATEAPEKEKITEAMKANRSTGERLLKLRKLNLKGVKLTVDRYLGYLQTKKDALENFKKTTAEARKNMNMIGENIKEIRNHFTDLMREEEFAIRWNRPSTVLPEEKEKATELGKSFPTEEEKRPTLQEKMAMNAEKYQKAYEKFMGDADLIDNLKDDLSSIVRTLDLKLKSIIEWGPEYKDNPYGGQGPKLDDMKIMLDELVKKLDKVDIAKEIDKVNELFNNLEVPKLYVELPKKDKEASVMFGLVEKLRKFSEFIKNAAERKVAPSNAGTFSDMFLYRKRQTPTGPRKLPGFFIQDTNKLAGKFVEYLEKTGLKDMIENPTADVTENINTALKKSLKMPGKIEDFLAAVGKRRFETDRDLKKAREDLKEIESRMVGKDQGNGGVTPGLRDELQTLKAKRIEPIERTLNFIVEPLEDLSKAVSGEKNKLSNLRELIQWANKKEDKNGFSVLDKTVDPSVRENKESLTGDEKEFVDKFNKITGQSFKNLPSKEEIEKQWDKIEKTPLDLLKITKSKEEAIRALKEMPKDVEKKVREMPTDVTGTRWYKEIQKDRSRHKTKWIDNIMKSVNEPVTTEEQYKTGLDRIKTNIVTILNEKNQQVQKATQIPVERIKAQFDAQIAAVNDLIQNKPNANVKNYRNFKVSVMDPLNAIVSTKDILSTMQVTKQALVSDYYKLKNFYDTEIKSKPEQAETLKKEQDTELNKIKANINYYEADIEKSKKTIDDASARAYYASSDFLKTLSDLIRHGTSSEESREYLKLLDPKYTDLRAVIEDVKKFQKQYKSVLLNEKSVIEAMKEQVKPASKGIKKEAAGSGYDPYGEQPTPYEKALEEKPGKDDLIVRDKPELYKKIQKTVNYFKEVLKKGPEDSFKYFENISKDIPDYVRALQEQIIPGLKSLLKQQVQIPGGEKIVTNLENSLMTLDNLMQSYSSENLKLKNRLEDESRRYGDTLNKIKGLEEFINPETGEFIDFTDKEKDILKRTFLRQLYKALDALWSQVPATMLPTMGPRDSEHYNNVWKAFKDMGGAKSNRRLISFLSLMKAEVRADKVDGENVNRIYLKSQQLEHRKQELEKGLRDLGLDPEKNKEIQELTSLIASMKEKEKAIDKIFNEMLKGAELKYISKIRENLREQMKTTVGGTEDKELIENYEAKGKKKDEEIVNESVEDVDKMLEKTENPKVVPLIKNTVDTIVAKAEKTIQSLEAELKKGGWSIESSSYRNHNLFNSKILYGATMQKAIKDMLKWEMQI